MASGSSIYNRIVREENALSEALSKVQSEMSLVRQRIHDIEADARDKISGIANIRISEIGNGALKERSDRAAIKILERRASAIGEASQRLEDLSTKLAVVSDEIDVADARLSNSEDALSKAVALTRDRLSRDEIWIRLSADVSGAEKIAEIAEKRFGDASAESRDKLADYHNSGIFMYLMGKGYGTDAYVAGNLVKMLDRRVASVCNYDVNIKNYNLLKELPVFMERSLAKARRAHEDAIESLADYELNEMAKDGIPELESDVMSDYGSVESLTKRRDSIKSEMHALSDDLDDYSTGNDKFSKDAHRVIFEDLADDSLSLLAKKAAETMSHEDDAIVESLRDMSAEVDRLSGSLKVFISKSDSLKRSRGLMSELISMYKRNGYNGSYSRFKSGFNVDDFLAGYLSGSIRMHDAISMMKRYHYKDTPSYSSSSSSRSGSGGFGTGGGFGGGGFSTGGGFGGGGGFRTGGGF